MSITNRYVRRSKISEAKFRELVRYFALDLDAHKIAALTRLNRNTVNRYLILIRKRIAEFSDEASPVEGGAIFDASRIGGREAGANGGGARLSAIDIFQRGGSIFTAIAGPEGAQAAPDPGGPDSILRPEQLRDGSPGGKDPSERERSANGIRAFRAYARRRLAKFRGVPGTTFYLHLKESEFRFNHRNRNIYLVVLKLLREKPLN